MRIAFLGTGTMGAPMARNLGAAGLDVTAWNRTAERAEGLGVTVAATPRGAAAGADVLVTMLADGPATEAVAGGAGGPAGAAGGAAVGGPAGAGGGALTALAPGAVWIQMSTVGVPAADRLAALAAEHGVAYVDAPVLGSREPAEAGELVILASGTAEQRERCAPVLDALGRRTVWLGQAGDGSRLKVVVNAWLMATTAALGETLALADALGVDPQGFFDVTDRGAIGALYTELNGASMVAREFPLRFPLVHATKDAALALEAAGDAAGEMRVLGATHAQFARAEALGHGTRDWAAVIYAALGA
jgi:3-hydroxyisobutyrate dehydrogenase